MQDWAVREIFHYEISHKDRDWVIEYIGADNMIWIYWVVIGDYEAISLMKVL